MVPIAIDARPLAVGIRPVLKLEPPFAAGLLPSSILAALVLDDNRRLDTNLTADRSDYRGRPGSFADDGAIIPINTEDGRFAGAPAESRGIQLAHEIAGAIALVDKAYFGLEGVIGADVGGVAGLAEFEVLALQPLGTYIALHC